MSSCFFSLHCGALDVSGSSEDSYRSSRAMLVPVSWAGTQGKIGAKGKEEERTGKEFDLSVKS
jgi:hypothetical protein